MTAEIADPADAPSNAPTTRTLMPLSEALGNPYLAAAGFAFDLPLDLNERTELVRIFAVIGTEAASELFVVGS